MLSNTQIDKLGSRLRSGEIDEASLRDLEEFRRLFSKSYSQVEDVLVNKMGLKITGRPSKSTVAIIDKLKRETIRLSQVQDIAGCRVLVRGLADQDRLVENMQIMFSSPEVDDKRRVPTHGYRAIHVVVSIFGRPVEVQVRTALQHSWANLSEKVADAFGHSIKYGAGDPEAIAFLKQLSDATERLEVVRHNRLALSQDKMRSGVTKLLRNQAKHLSAQERLIMREIHAIFSGRVPVVAQ